MLYVLTDRIGSDTLLEQWVNDKERPCIVYYHEDGSWSAIRLTPDAVEVDELRYAPR